ncbi:hypothetical protein [Streptomyces sp. NRRL S-87]|uniref:hypothetical protein n=1 Tax=Streptomyces sp. NRRL S-87 TaxID=1463920 RepID=UPI0004C0FD2E|nr:hypothetical protein [Streptomyces sp. NRRL S-87]
MSPGFWQAAGTVALMAAVLIVATFLVLLVRASRKRTPRDRRPRLYFSAPAVIAAVLGFVLGALATGRSLHLGLDEFRALSVPISAGLAAHGVLRTRGARVAEFAGAAIALTIGTLVSGATTYFGF